MTTPDATSNVMEHRNSDMAIAFAAALETTERLAAPDLATYQARLIEPLLQHAKKHAPFYAQRLDAVLPNGRLDMARWREVPILTRAEAQDRILALRAAYTPSHLGQVQQISTSGSTGTALAIQRNELAQVAGLAHLERIYRWWGYDGRRAMATLASPRTAKAPPPAGKSFRGWRIDSSDGPFYVLDNTVTDDEIIDWLVQRRPDYLTITSSLIAPICRRIEQRGIGLRLKGIIGRSNTITEQARELARRVLKARIADQYGSEEAGHIAGECPTCGSYHISAESVLVEVVDADGLPAAEGALGRVVVTPFYSYAMPFIRYEIGDYAMAGSSGQPCWIKLPSLQRIVGRFRNVYVRRDGRVIYPGAHAPGGRLHELVQCRQLQLVQTGHGEIEVRYVPVGPASDPDLAEIATYLSAALQEEIRVRATQVATIERSADGKFEDFVSLLATPGSSPMS